MRFPLLRFYSSLKRHHKILFFGSDDVSLVSLKNVNELRKKDIIQKLALVTANKSQKLTQIEQYAKAENILRLSWNDLKLDKNEFDLGVVVSFGYLISEDIINKFPLGMVNVHTSLLPRWRGAAPVIHTLLNGDKETGVTLMKIRPKHFDIGEIISQKSIPVHPDVTLPELTEQLAVLGGKELVKCIKNLPDSLEKATLQPPDGVTYAKKITADISDVRWTEMTAEQVYNVYRAVHGLFDLRTRFKGKCIKLFNAYLVPDDMNTDLAVSAGCVSFSRNRNAIKVLCKDNRFIYFKSVRIIGKREICALDFYNGYLRKCSKTECYFT